MQKYLQKAIKLAREHDYDEFVEYQLCAVIARGGNVVSVGFNHSKTNGFVEHYTDQIVGPDRGYSMSTHAEMDAVLSVRAKTDLRGCKIYVARVRPPGNLDGDTLGMARPCSICQNVLWAYGIQRAYYTIDDNNYGVMKIVQRDNPGSKADDQKFYVGD